MIGRFLSLKPKSDGINEIFQKGVDIVSTYAYNADIDTMSTHEKKETGDV